MTIKTHMFAAVSHLSKETRGIGIYLDYHKSYIKNYILSLYLLNGIKSVSDKDDQE